MTERFTIRRCRIAYDDVAEAGTAEEAAAALAAAREREPDAGFAVWDNQTGCWSTSVR
jgi:hypothetical protein